VDGARPIRSRKSAKQVNCIHRRPASDDQRRKCFEFAQSNGWIVDPLHVYVDESLSAIGSDRPGYRALLCAALAKPRVLDAVLVDDTSRLSRSLPEVINVQQRLAIDGIRLIAVSQGIDSLHEQAELLSQFTASSTDPQEKTITLLMEKIVWQALNEAASVSASPSPPHSHCLPNRPVLP
jgi:DNA invertase Pin-like site-specific DNA recombinase